jgi:hypothetical protein
VEWQESRAFAAPRHRSAHRLRDPSYLFKVGVRDVVGADAKARYLNQEMVDKGFAKMV